MLEDGALAISKVCRTRGWNSLVSHSAFWQNAAVGASIKVYLRKGKIPPSRERSEDRSVRNHPADTKVREEGGEEVLQELEQIPSQQGPHQSRYQHHSLRRTT